MKKILLLLTLSLLLFSCTFIEHANTNVYCPCMINEVSYYNGGYKVKATSIENPSRWFTFKTTKFHQVGDIIQ